MDEEALPGPPVLWSVPVLEAAVCAQLRQRVETLFHDFVPGDQPPPEEPGLGRRHRVTFRDDGLAEALGHALRPGVPATLEGWSFTRLNPVFRASRYKAGGWKAPHQDAPWVRDGRERSLFSVLLHVNDDFEGGRLRFHSPNATLRPRSGVATCFWHSLLHESCAVSAGAKYTLRTDAIYRR